METKNESILEIYPIFRNRNNPGISDYRFSCTTPENDLNKKLEVLEPYNEGYVLIDKQNTFIGIQNHFGTRQIRSDITISDDTMLYYLMYIIAPGPDHIVKTAYEYCKNEGLLQELQKFAEIATKTGLKLEYHRKKVGQITFNEFTFINNTILRYFDKNKELKEFYCLLQEDILLKQEDKNEFIFYFTYIGIDMAQYAPLNILFNVN